RPEFCTQHGMPAFRWQIPERFNMGADVSDRHGAAIALIEIEPSGKTRELTFDAISALSNRLANVLVARGLERGDRIAILLPQRHETAVAHVPAQGRAACAPDAPRPPARSGVSARWFSTARRPLLDARGLGLDRRIVRRRDALLAPRRDRGRTPPAEVRSGRGDAADGAA